MPSDIEQAVLRDILHHLDLVEQFTQGQDYGAFRTDTLRIYAVTRCLEIISEASRRLSDGLKARHPAIAWREMAGAGNVYRHDYEEVAVKRIWDTVQLALPPLRAVMVIEMGRLPPKDSR
jgi:uncharacterized protein with HEPN domain